MSEDDRRSGERRRRWRQQTRMVRDGQVRSPHGETAEAMYLTSGYVYESAEQARDRFKGDADGYIYSRYGNPTVTMFEDRLAALEGAEACRATASGMSAVFASLMCQLNAGDHVVASRVLFGSCHVIVAELLPRYGIETTLVDGPDLDQWRAAMRPNTRCVFFETPANPTLELIDIQAVCEIAHEAGARVIVDNVFATPLLQKPMELGADIVVYSATKHIDGQGRVLGGAILSDQKFCDEELIPLYRHTGPSMSPFNAWVLLKGLETLELRVARMCDNAAEVARMLAETPGVLKTLYPERPDFPQAELYRRQMSRGSTLVSFEVEGGREAAFRLLNALETIDISNNLGDAKSLITHPATTTHQRFPPEEREAVGITEGLVRMSVGLEDVEDLKDDLRAAIAAI
ncbi:MAG: O-succinylhomoserine sulfhydrylase [Alphaproteobacteria bacterium]|nr:O-succinylhomoserine sulfhydrylase [Alphaproteobacteria bacterium]